MSRLILVLGDQLTRSVAALREYRDGDVVVMAEVHDEATYVPHHPRKIAFLFAAMRKFAAHLRAEGCRSPTPRSTIPRTPAPSPVS